MAQGIFGSAARALVASGLVASLGATFGVTFGAPPAALARPIVPSERRYEPFDTSNMPNCGDPLPLNEISTRFHEREAEFWRTGLEIVAFEGAHEIGFRSNGLDYIPRRYCEAYARMSDDKLRPLSYSIAKDLGGLGDWFGVEWCVGGLDRFYADAPNCKMARP